MKIHYKNITPSDIKMAEEQFFRVLMLCSTLLIIIALVLLISSILVKGLPALSWEMISQSPKGGSYFSDEEKQ